MIKKALPTLIVILFIISFNKACLVILIPLLFILRISGSKVDLDKKLVLLLLLPIISGFCSGIGNNLSDMIKDVFYFSLPIMFFFLGHIIASYISLRKMFSIIITAGVVMALLRVVIILSWSGLGALISPYSARMAYGILFGTPITAVALGVLVFFKVYNVKLYSYKRYNVYFLICLVGLPMFASRTYFIIGLICILVALYYKYRIRLAAGLFFLIISILSISVLTKSTSSSNPFIEKVFNSFDEIHSGDYGTEEDINTRYRGFESFMAMKSYFNSDLTQKVFGNFGKLIDLETYVSLNEDGLRYIPILHNGYCYMIIKSGLLGCFFYLLFFIRLIMWSFKKFKSKYDHESMIGGIVLSLIIGLILTNYIVYSLYNTEMLMLVFIISYMYSEVSLYKRVESNKYNTSNI